MPSSSSPANWPGSVTPWDDAGHTNERLYKPTLTCPRHVKPVSMRAHSTTSVEAASCVLSTDGGQGNITFRVCLSGDSLRRSVGLLDVGLPPVARREALRARS